MDLPDSAVLHHADSHPLFHGAGVLGLMLGFVLAVVGIGVALIPWTRLRLRKWLASLCFILAAELILGLLLDPSGFYVAGPLGLVAWTVYGIRLLRAPPQLPGGVLHDPYHRSRVAPRRGEGGDGAPSVSRLLRSESAVVPFRARERELEQLEDRCARPRGLGVGMVLAPGGSGKTRLASELCSRAERLGVVAGFPLPDLTGERVRGLVGRVPVLIVIDEANSRPSDVRETIAALSDLDGPAPLRVLAQCSGPVTGAAK
jgi:hypothetical protein